MNAPRTKCETMPLEDATISNMWEIAAIAAVLERLGMIIEMGQRVAKGATHLLNRVRGFRFTF